MFPTEPRIPDEMMARLIAVYNRLAKEPIRGLMNAPTTPEDKRHVCRQFLEAIDGGYEALETFCADYQLTVIFSPYESQFSSYLKAGQIYIKQLFEEENE